MTSHLCTRMRVQAEFYFDGVLSPQEEAAFNDHLAACTACAAAVGEDLALMDKLSTLPTVAFERRPATGRPRIAAVAAAAALFIAGGAFWAGRATSPSSSVVPSTVVAGGPESKDRFDDDIVPLALEVPGAELAFAAPSAAEAVLVEAERDLINVERSELRRRLGALDMKAGAIEVELSARALEPEAKLSGAALVASLRDSYATSGSSDARSAGRKAFFASRFLRENADDAVEPLKTWLREAKTPEERRYVVRIVARAAAPAFVAMLVEEATRGTSRELAMDGLAKLQDPRCLDVARRLASDPKSTEVLKARAAAALHRLGDAEGTRLLKAAIASKSLDAEQRRRLFFDLASRPSRDVLDFVEHAPETASLPWSDRVALAEMLANVSGPDALRPAKALFRHDGERGERAVNRAFHQFD